jgi:MSHA biogenesis protein MshK
MANRLTRCCTLGCLLLAQTALAYELIDPTRPAVSLEVVEPASGVGNNDTLDQTKGLRLIIIKKNRRAAIIDGKTLELGGKFGVAKLVEVNEGSVVLQGPQGRQVLSLFPQVKIKQQQGATSLPVTVKSSGKNKNLPVANKEDK